MTRILIIDDSAYQRYKIRQTVEAAGYELLEATNGDEGLEIAITAMPDCILLDLLMPDMRGEEILKSLRDQELGIPVIVLTADVQESTRQECLRLGATTFITKPVQETELLHTITQTLNKGDREEVA